MWQRGHIFELGRRLLDFALQNDNPFHFKLFFCLLFGQLGSVADNEHPIVFDELNDYFIHKYFYNFTILAPEKQIGSKGAKLFNCLYLQSGFRIGINAVNGFCNNQFKLQFANYLISVHEHLVAVLNPVIRRVKEPDFS